MGLGEGYFYMAEEQIRLTEQYMCRDRRWVENHYYVITDQPKSRLPAWQGWDWALNEDISSRIFLIHAERLGWPKDSDRRFQFIADAIDERNLADKYTYMFWQDADNMLNAHQCEDMMGTLVAARHGHVYHHEGYPYESRKESKAYVPEENMLVQPYYSAHLYGGSSREFHKLVRTCADWTSEDQSKGITARVDDESYLNAYMYHNYPSVTLSMGFCWNEGYDIPWMSRVKHFATAIQKGRMNATRL
jgi:hypothetical protein